MDAKATKPAWIRTKRFPPNLYLRRNGNYYLRTFSGGKEKWTSLKTDILEVAKSKLRDHMDRIAAFRVSGIRQVSGPLGFEQALAIFMGQLKASAKRPNTKAFYEAGAKLVQRTWPDIVSTKLPSLTALDVQTWLQCFVANAKPHVPPRAKSPARTSSGASVTTLKCALGTLRKILDIAVLSGHLPSNPARHANVASTMKELIGKIDREQSERGDSLTLPSRQDFGKLVELVRNAGVSDCRAAADYIEFIAYCGARKNEAINVEWRDIDFREGSIRLRVTKNGKVRHPPMFGSMRTLLERLKCERGQTRQNDPVLLVKEAQGFITSACRKLGIPRFTTHGLRHYFGTTCLELGVDAPTVAKWLGHKDKGALLLKIYAHVRPDHEKRMIRKVDLGGFGTMGHPATPGDHNLG